VVDGRLRPWRGRRRRGGLAGHEFGQARGWISQRRRRTGGTPGAAGRRFGSPGGGRRRPAHSDGAGSEPHPGDTRRLRAARITQPFEQGLVDVGVPRDADLQIRALLSDLGQRFGRQILV
jgi:hypothetical protein